MVYPQADLRDVIASLSQLDHILARWTRLPPPLFRNIHQLLDILIHWAKSIMFLLLAGGASLSRTTMACGHASGDADRLDPFGTLRIAAVGTIRRLKFIPPLDESGHGGFGQEGYAREEWNDSGAATRREERRIRDRSFEKGL